MPLTWPSSTQRLALTLSPADSSAAFFGDLYADFSLTPEVYGTPYLPYETHQFVDNPQGEAKAK